MFIKYKNFILQEKLFLIFTLSFILFWLRAVNCEISLYNIGKMIVGLLINIPLFFLVSSNLRIRLSKLFGGRYKYLKLCTYLVFISLLYSIFIAEEHIYFSWVSYFVILFSLITFHLWQPALILILGYLLIDRCNESELTVKVIIFVIGICIFSKVFYVLFPKFFFLTKYHIYNLSLIKVYFNNTSDTFELYNFWWMSLTILIISFSNISFSHIGFNKKLNQETIIFTSFFALFIILPFFLNNIFKYEEFIIQKFVWHILSAIYSSIRVPFLEEILFRGIIQTYFCTKLSRIKDGNIVAIIISSIIFGLFHYPFIDGSFSPFFIHGFVYGWLYYRTQNIWSPIFLHGLNNFLVYVFK